MIHINCDGPMSEDTGRSFCPIKPAANEFSCETCREYQTRLATFESENRLELDMLRFLEGGIWSKDEQ
jgi:hypothetical protein